MTKLPEETIQFLYGKHSRYQEEGMEISGWGEFARAIEAEVLRINGGGGEDDDALFKRAHAFGCRYDGNGCWDMPPWLDGAELICFMTGRKLPPHYKQDENGWPVRSAPQSQQAEPGAVLEGPPYGTKRKAAMAIYTPPFKFVHGYIYDSANNMVADQDGFDGKVAEAVAARVRGWGRIGYMPNPEELQDEVGQMMADALTAYYAAPKPQGE